MSPDADFVSNVFKLKVEMAKCDSPVAAGKVDSEGSYVEGLLVRLKVQDSDQCFLLQTVRAVLEPEGINTIKTKRLYLKIYVSNISFRSSLKGPKLLNNKC